MTDFSLQADFKLYTFMCSHIRSSFILRSIRLKGDYITPDLSCRRAIEASDLLCICRLLSPEDEIFMSVLKFVDLARDCNKTFPVGTKCGSWTVPASPPKAY
ncbi:hypothetical protein EJB05_57514, partial [Eragrostis curvula]